MTRREHREGHHLRSDFQGHSSHQHHDMPKTARGSFRGCSMRQDIPTRRVHRERCQFCGLAVPLGSKLATKTATEVRTFFLGCSERVAKEGLKGCGLKPVSPFVPPPCEKRKTRGSGLN